MRQTNGGPTAVTQRSTLQLAALWSFAITITPVSVFLDQLPAPPKSHGAGRWTSTSAGTFLGCQQAVAAMVHTGGAIINIASVRGQRRSSGQIAYCASKALVISLTESVALHCGEQGSPIRCNAVCPGVIDTPILTELKARWEGTKLRINYSATCSFSIVSVDLRSSVLRWPI